MWLLLKVQVYAADAKCLMIASLLIAPKKLNKLQEKFSELARAMCNAEVTLFSVFTQITEAVTSE